MRETILTINDVATKDTILYVPDKRYYSGKRIVRLGHVTTEEINKALKKYPKATSMIIGGWPMSIETYNKLLEKGSIHW